MDVSAKDLKQALLHAIEIDQLVLPTLPKIALQAREAASNSDTNIKKLQSLLPNNDAFRQVSSESLTASLLEATAPSTTCQQL